MPCGDKNRDQSDASTSQDAAKIASKPPGLGEGHGVESLSRTAEGTNLVHTLVLDFQLPEP